MKIASLYKAPLGILIAIVVVASVGQVSHALSGTGYFTGVQTCTATNNFRTPNCGTSSPPYSNDVIPGRSGGGSPDSIPDWATTSTGAFYSWISSNYNSGDPHMNLGIKFIVATMNGGSTSLSEFQNRLANPAVGIQVSYEVPPGQISFMGITNDGSRRMDAFFSNYRSGARRLIVFTYNGNRVYVLEKPCGNPVGGLPGLPSAINWNIGGSTSVSSGTAQPGQTVTFADSLVNYGPNNTTGNIWWVSEHPSPSPWAGGATPIGAGQTLVVQRNDFTVPANATADQQFCQRIRWDPTNNRGGGLSYGGYACVRVVYNYQLTPIATSPDRVVTNGGTLKFDYTVNKTGTRTYDTKWVVRTIIAQPGASVPNGPGTGVHDNFSCASYAAPRVSCTDSAAQSQVFINSSTALLSEVMTGISYPVGTKVCRVLSVDSRDQLPASRTRDSAMICVVVAKKPLTQLWGNDLRVGSALAVGANSTSRIEGSFGTFDGKVKGSWTEYGVFAPGTVTAMASGAGFARDDAAAAQSDWSKLTFANTGSFGNFANKTAIGILPDIPRYFGLPTTQGVTKELYGDVTINSFREGVVIIASGTVTINSQMKASSGNINNDGEIKQMVIIANNINISKNVQDIDAWLIAPNGTINTCYDEPEALVASMCDKKLTINGPVMAKVLKLRRTFGDGGESAENINLRGDAYLWAHNLSVKNGSWKTKFVSELPPRY